eukprot:CAMPEP_0177565448 /NCGR_PEP_ID=MMETSP0369-20130122/74147_1 /TAXON_ID=447022 ORGANISM="Scrippsiella hangoei-like, Strain SHHI-4" /NCGR_SAMPLE_ID=MMETSP0369 /ASSEMBLY_ACC=CAM_ASM_000364 /LENGTH=298 /DNA_ID=CAMNT_0019052789 /DNA_START=130 /DNA_END=1024 /DNA_ORIENTATION=-
MLCGGLWRGVHRMAREERSQDEAFGKRPEGVEVQVQPRTYLLDGSLYQNQYMTLWNANNMPVSVELRVLPKDHFELIVDHLDSQGGGDGAWMKIRGTFHTEPISGASGTSGRLRLVPSLPSEAEGGEGFSYDESVLTSSTAFAFRCLKRWGASSLISALQLELDIAEESVIVTPRSSIIRMLWDESVALRRTTEEKMWNSGAARGPPIDARQRAEAPHRGAHGPPAPSHAAAPQALIWLRQRLRSVGHHLPQRLSEGHPHTDLCLTAKRFARRSIASDAAALGPMAAAPLGAGQRVCG